MGSSSSRLFGTLAQTLSSAPLARADLDQDPDQNPDEDPAVLANPDQLLRECEEALLGRPARPHRDLVFPCTPAHQHHSQYQHAPIRVMQWNILAQGRIGNLLARSRLGILARGMIGIRPQVRPVKSQKRVGEVF